MQQSINILDIKVNYPIPEEYKVYVKCSMNYRTGQNNYKSIFDTNFDDYWYQYDDNFSKKIKNGILGNRPEVDYYINNCKFHSTKSRYNRQFHHLYTPMPLSKMRFGLTRNKLFNQDEFEKILNCAINATTEDEVLELINNNKITKEIFEKIEDKFQVIQLVKSKNGRKNIEKVIYKIKSSLLVQKMIKEYNIDVKSSLSKAITSKLPDIIYSLLTSLSKAQKYEYFTKIIRILPDLLVNPECTIELINELESIETIRWKCFGPEPGEFSDYYLKNNLKDYILARNMNSDILEYVFEKINPEISQDNLKDYLSMLLKKNNLSNDFYEIMSIFKKYSKELE